LVGILLSVTLTLFVTWWRERRERKYLAATLLAELHVQAAAVADLVQVTSSGKEFSVCRLELPPEPRLFDALAPKLTMLPPAAAGNLVAFFASSERSGGLGRHIVSYDDLPETNMQVIR
jgi:hypothetical protein